MNLIQIQEHLKDLPTQAIMAYANGQNPQVPPYMALGEMNRRKNMEQRAAQAPDSSVKEKLEGELAQQIALPGVGQGMNMRINPAGMPPPMPAGQPQMAPQMPKMPVPPMARPMAPQMIQPGGMPGMAEGGLATLPMDQDMFNYAPGGIVAFADEGLVPSPTSLADESVSGTYSGNEGESNELPVGLANRLLRDQLLGRSNLPQPVSREQVQAEVLAQKPELAGILNKLPGQTLMALAAKLEEQNQAQRDRFQEGEGSRGLAALSQALIAAGEATRGQKGMGLGAAFGGFGKSYNAATAATEDRVARQQALERAQTMETMKLQSDIEQMQRAYAEGNIDKAMRLKEQINAREAKIVELQGTGVKEVLTQADRIKQRAEQERHNKEVERLQQIQANTAAQRAKFDREDRPTGEEKLLAKIQANVVKDEAYRTLAKKLQDAEIGSDEYYKILDAMREIALPYYPVDAKGKYKVEPPPKVGRAAPVDKPVEEQGAISKFLFGPKPASPVRPTAVPFDQLPK
jgi:hypothetical protein